MYAAAGEIGLGESLDARYTERLARFTKWMDRVRQECAQNDPIQRSAAWSWTSTTRTGCARTLQRQGR